MKIILTAAGHMGGYTLVEQFRKKGITVIGTDMNSNSAARRYCDGFYTTPNGESDDFIHKMLDIVKKEKPDAILPASSCEVLSLARNKERFEKLGTKVIVSDPEVIETTIDKYKTFEALKGKIHLPKYIYSDKGYYSKPTIGKGRRGIEELNKKNVMIMETLDGEHIDADVLSSRGKLLACFCKTRERAYGGTLVEGELVNRPDIVKKVKKIVKVIPLEYVSVIQFIGGDLIEINPRIAGVFIGTGRNLPIEAIKMALGEKINIPKPQFGLKTSRFIHQYDY